MRGRGRGKGEVVVETSTTVGHTITICSLVPAAAIGADSNYTENITRS